MKRVKLTTFICGVSEEQQREKHFHQLLQLLPEIYVRHIQVQKTTKAPGERDFRDEFLYEAEKPEESAGHFEQMHSAFQHTSRIEMQITGNSEDRTTLHVAIDFADRRDKLGAMLCTFDLKTGELTRGWSF